MSEAWSRFFMAIALIVASGAIAYSFGVGKAADWAGWAQFAGSLIALAVAWWVGHREALDRRAEAETYRLEREEQRRLRDEVRVERLAKWVDALRSAGTMVRNAAAHANRDSANADDYENMRFTSFRLLRQSRGGLDLLLSFEPPKYEVSSYLVAAREYFRPSLAQLDVLETLDFTAPNRKSVQAQYFDALKKSAERLEFLLEEYKEAQADA